MMSLTCRCSGCVKCYDLRGDCQRVLTEDVDWCEPCADEYEYTLRPVMFDAFEEPNQQVTGR